MRRKQVHTHLSPEEHDLIRQAAERAGLDHVSTYIRHTMLAQARQTLGKTDWLAKARAAVQEDPNK